MNNYRQAQYFINRASSSTERDHARTAATIAVAYGLLALVDKLDKLCSKLDNEEES